MPSVRTAVWSCMRPGAERPGPQGASLLVGDDGGLLRVQLLLARDERPPPGPARARAADLHLRAVDPQFHAPRRRVGEHVRQGAQPQAGLARHGEPAGSQQRPDLPDRAADGGPVNPVQLREGRVRELEPQVNEGDDDPVGEHEVVVRACAGRASRSWSRRSRSRASPAAVHGPASSAISLPSVRRRIPVKIRCDKAARAHLDDTSRSFRAAARVHGTDTPQSPATPQKFYRAPNR